MAGIVVCDVQSLYYLVEYRHPDILIPCLETNQSPLLCCESVQFYIVDFC